MPRKLAADAHAVETSWEMDSPEARILPLRAAMSSLPDQFMIDLGDGVLPQLRLGNPRAEVARDGSHVAVQQLVPRLGERVCELVRILVEALRDRLVDRIHLQRKVRRQHHRGVPLRRIMSIRHGALGRGIRGSPLLRTGGARRQLPVVLEQVVEVPVVPLRRLVGPCALQPAGERVGALAAAEGVPPAEALLLEGATLGFRTDVLRTDCTMALAEGVAADDERNRLLVVHRHTSEGLSNVPGGSKRIRVAVGPLRIHVDQAHLHGAERIGELPVAAVALISEPRVLRAPEDLLGLPDVLSPEAEAERLEPHRFEGTVAGEDDQIGPGDLPAVLLLDRPEQPARLVEVRVVGPTVEGGKALSAAAATAPAIGDAVRACGMPRHPDEQRPVVAVVGRPPVLRRRHHLEDVLLQRVEVEGLELLCVVEVLAHRIGQGRVLVENLQVQLIRPPVLVRPGPSRLRRRGRDYWVLAFAAAVRHVR